MTKLSFTLFFIILALPFHLQAKDQNKDIHKVCETNYSQCLKLLDEEYSKTLEKSFKWYKLKLYEIDAYFQLKSLKERLELITPLLLITEAPYNFKISIYIDYAKSHFLLKEYDTARLYADKALSMLQESANAFGDPLKLVQLVNLKTYQIGLDHKEGRITDPQTHYLESFNLLLKLYAENKHSSSMLMMTELLGNLGHLARHLGRFDDGIEYFQQAMYWTNLRNNDQQTGVIYSNIARLYKMSGNSVLALENYSKSIEYFKLVNDIGRVGHSKLSMIQIYIENKQHPKARKLLEGIIEDEILDFHQAKYLALKKQLFTE